MALTKILPSGLNSANDFSSLVPAAYSTANAAFAQANAAYSAANNATDSWVRTQANNAYDKANSGASFANAAFTTANNEVGGFAQANAAYLAQNTTAGFANSAYTTANASYVSQNTTAGFANASYLAANSAAIFANAAFARANAAFAAANSGGGGGGGGGTGIIITTDGFTANGSTTQFQLSVMPSSEDFITAVVDGTVQYRSSYTVDGTGLVTFDTTFENGALIEITSIVQGNANVSVITTKKYYTFVQTGTFPIPTYGISRNYPVANSTISNVFASLGRASTTTFGFDLLKNGTVVGSYTIPANTYRMGGVGASIVYTTSDYLTINITSGADASDLKVDLEYS